MEIEEAGPAGLGFTADTAAGTLLDANARFLAAFSAARRLIVLLDTVIWIDVTMGEEKEKMLGEIVVQLLCVVRELCDF